MNNSSSHSDKRKMVSFSDSVEVFCFEKTTDKVLIHDMFYQPEDYQKFKSMEDTRKMLLAFGKRKIIQGEKAALEIGEYLMDDNCLNSDYARSTNRSLSILTYNVNNNATDIPRLPQRKASIENMVLKEFTDHYWCKSEDNAQRAKNDTPRLPQRKISIDNISRKYHLDDHWLDLHQSTHSINSPKDHSESHCMPRLPQRKISLENIALSCRLVDDHDFQKVEQEKSQETNSLSPLPQRKASSEKSAQKYRLDNSCLKNDFALIIKDYFSKDNNNSPRLPQRKVSIENIAQRYT